MATLMGIERLHELLGEAERGGCRLAWIENGALLTGPTLGQPRFSVDFAGERLTAASPKGAAGPARFTEGGRPSEQAPGDAALPRTLVELGDRGGRRTGNFALILEDKIYPAKSQRELLRVAMQAIERARPGTLGKLSLEKGRTKRPVARRRELLYENPKLSKHAEEIEGGWWIATNNSYPEVEKFVRRAGFLAGLHVDLRRSP